MMFYPVDEAITLSNATKAELKKAINPDEHGIAIQSVTKMGNSGVVVDTSGGPKTQRKCAQGSEGGRPKGASPTGRPECSSLRPI